MTAHIGPPRAGLFTSGDGMQPATVTRPRLRKIRPRYWMNRLYIALSAGLSIVVMSVEPASLGHQIINKSGPIGWACIAALGLVCLTAVMDVVINDMLPSHYVWRCAHRWRHWVYMALALGLASVVYVVVMAEGRTTLILPFMLDAIAATTIAVADLFHKYRGSLYDD